MSVLSVSPARFVVAPAMDPESHGFSTKSDVHASGTKQLPNILLVEDNPADILLMREALATYQVESQLFIAEDGDEAFRLIEDIEASAMPCPDLIVLDLNLPRKTGMEVLERLRASPKCGDKPVLIFSSSEAPSDRSRAAMLGASCYVRKSSDLKEFLSVGGKLREMLSGKFD